MFGLFILIPVFESWNESEQIREYRKDENENISINFTQNNKTETNFIICNPD